MITLSNSTIKSCLQPNNSHNWINRINGIMPEERPEWDEGTKVHRLIQRHISGKELHPYLSSIKFTFPIVEEENRDPRTKFTFKVGDKYEIVGYLDGIDYDNKRFLEIKSSTTPWGPAMFRNSYQRKIYSIPHKDFTEAILITCQRDPKVWKQIKPKVRLERITDKDREDAYDYINKAIKLLESGDYTGGLIDGKCILGVGCYYGENCMFKKWNIY